MWGAKRDFKVEVVEAEKGVTCELPLATLSEVFYEAVCAPTGSAFLRFAKEKASQYGSAAARLQNGSQGC
jgi:hypothetical protein